MIYGADGAYTMSSLWEQDPTDEERPGTSDGM
jgi:hypothetical protein